MKHRSDLAPTQPTRPSEGGKLYLPDEDQAGRAPDQVDAFQQLPPRPTPPTPHYLRPRRRRLGCGPCGCSTLIFGLLFFAGILAIYLLAPLRTNVLFLGIDYAPPGSSVARSDTIILARFNPAGPYVGLLSIPRDLWVDIPGVGANRINTAHFYAEARQPGLGPVAARETVELNFNLDVHYYARLRFESVREIVDALGGVVVDFPQPMAGYPAGRHHLTGSKALAFARHRLGSDDFFRMQRGQLLLKAIFRQMMQPESWRRLPRVALVAWRAVETDIPAWQWPRLAITILRVGPEGIDNRSLTREMVIPYTTDLGASVLLPNWERINPVIWDMFGR